jgi:hypothetical protein
MSRWVTVEVCVVRKGKVIVMTGEEVLETL